MTLGPRARRQCRHLCRGSGPRRPSGAAQYLWARSEAGGKALLSDQSADDAETAGLEGGAPPFTVNTATTGSWSDGNTPLTRVSGTSTLLSKRAATLE